MLRKIPNIITLIQRQRKHNIVPDSTPTLAHYHWYNTALAHYHWYTTNDLQKDKTDTTLGYDTDTITIPTPHTVHDHGHNTNTHIFTQR